MKLSNKFILDALYFGDPKVTPLSLGFLEYTAKVNEVITEEFRKEIGANPIKGSSLELRIAKASKTFATIARRKFKKYNRTYKRAVAQHYFKTTTHIPLRQKKVKPNVTSSGDAKAGPTPKPFQNLGRTQQHERINNVKAAANGDVDLLLAAAVSASKGLDLNSHFVLKAIKKDPGIAVHLKSYIEKDFSK